MSVARASHLLASKFVEKQWHVEIIVRIATFYQFQTRDDPKDVVCWTEKK